MTDGYAGAGSLEWDLEKARINAGKHRVTFEEAMSAFNDPSSIAVPDPDHSHLEERLILLGFSDHQRLLTVVYVEREDNLRLISARTSTSNEKRKYEEEIDYGF